MRYSNLHVVTYIFITNNFQKFNPLLYNAYYYCPDYEVINGLVIAWGTLNMRTTLALSHCAGVGSHTFGFPGYRN